MSVSFDSSESVPDQAARDPRIVRSVLKRDLIPYVAVLLDLVAGRFDLRAVVELLLRCRVPYH